MIVKRVMPIIILPIFLLFFISCAKSSETKLTDTKPMQPQAPTPVKQDLSLSDIQITACNAAHNARTCDTRLPELGIVLKEECCKQLGKCC